MLEKQLIQFLNTFLLNKNRHKKPDKYSKIKNNLNTKLIKSHFSQFHASSF